MRNMLAAYRTGFARKPQCGAHIHHKGIAPSVRARYVRAGASALHASAQREPRTYDELWGAFSSKAEGEWEGVTATFDANGVPQPLPDRYVPDAYKDWGVEIFDWQSQSSCLMRQAPDRGLKNIFKRLTPTVGCEAEAIAYVEEVADVWQADGGSAVKPVTPDGGFLAAPARLPADGGRAKVEACLAAPGGSPRLRVTLLLARHSESKRWEVISAELSREVYEGPFNGGAYLSGCAGGGRPFAKDPVTKLEQLEGQWRAGSVLRYGRSGPGRALELQPPTELEGGRTSTLAGTGALLLPLGVWVGCCTEDEDVALEVGALRDDSERDTVACKFKDGNMEEVTFATERKLF